jgi:hypothetical protein
MEVIESLLPSLTVAPALSTAAATRRHQSIVPRNVSIGGAFTPPLTKGRVIPFDIPRLGFGNLAVRREVFSDQQSLPASLPEQP